MPPDRPQTGPYAGRAGFGTLAEAMSGFVAITGEPDGPPTLPPMGLAHTLAGLTAVTATMTALFHRDRPGGSGRGQVVDVSLLEPMVTAVGPGPAVHHQTGRLQPRTGNRSASNAPRNSYRSEDGRWVAISTSATTVAERVLRLVGHPEVIDEPWFGSASGRAEHVDLLDLAVVDLDLTRTVTPELCRSAQDHWPFEGVEVRGWPVTTVVRGHVMHDGDEVADSFPGTYQRRVD